MRRAVTLSAAAVVLVGPTVLAFFSGGYFDEPRLYATMAAWAVVLAMAVTSPRPLPTSWPGRVALGGLVLICLWTAASITWAPLAGPATDYTVRMLLYVGALVGAMALLREPWLMRAVEPAFAAGAVVVVGYGLSGRLLPGLIELSRSESLGGRLEQPITYWNAEGALAAMGFVLCARLAGDESRPRAVRILSAASAVSLGMGVYLTLSRGAMAAGVVGLAVLLAVAPTRSQLRAILTVLPPAVVAAAVAAAFPGVASLDGTLGDRETEGAIMLAVLAVLMLATGLACAWQLRGEARGRLAGGRLGIASRLPAVALAVTVLTVVGLVAGGIGERGNASITAKDRSKRLTSLQSRRYDYWRIGLNAFADQPLQGLGAAGFRVEWLRERPVRESARDVHSLPLEMAAELGIIGLLGFGMLVTGGGLAARRALRRGAPPLAGAAAATTVFVLHSTIDWDWEVPAVTLPALVMAGALIAASEAEPEAATESSAPAAHQPVARGTAVA